MRIVANFVLSAIELTLVVLIGLPILAYAGIAMLINWAELHGRFGGDRDAQDRARWQNS